LTTNSGYYEYSGIIHIHSRYSDGCGTIREIIKAAKKANLDYIIITDHNTLDAMKDGAEGWYDDLLLLVGEEIGGKGKSHYLAFGIADTIEPEGYQEDDLRYMEAVKRQGGIGFVAHPEGLRSKSFDIDLASWSAWDSHDYTGLEIWSYMCDWAESVTRFNILYYYLHPEKAISGPPPELLRRWDRLCQTRQIVGIGSSDIHAHYPLFLRFARFLSYRRAFQGVRTHLLTPSPLSSGLDESKELVYTALGSGHCFFAHDSLADSTGFNFTASTGEGQKLLMGDEIELESEAELEVISPVPVSLRLFCNGQLMGQETSAKRLTRKTNRPGVYRVEARYRGKPWIYTNPIYLR